MEQQFSGNRRLSSSISKLRGQGGQIIVEAILLMTLSIGILFFVTRTIREQGVMQNLVQGPTEKLSGMMESGVWAPPEEAKKNHPNMVKRSLSLEPRGR